MFPALYIKFPLAICFTYGNVYVSMLFSHIIPSPTVSKIARTWKQPRCPSADEWIRKLWHIYTMKYYSDIKRNALESVLTRWMNPESVIQSEVSQKENDKYCILTHIYGISKDGTDDPKCKAAKETGI